MASSRKEQQGTVTERASAAAQQRQQPLHRLGEWSAGQRYPPQKPRAFPTTVFDTQNPVHGQGKNFAPMGVEEFLASIWTAEETNATVNSRGPLPVPSTLLLDNAHQQQHHSFGPCTSLSRHHRQRPLQQQHQQSQNGMSIVPMFAEHHVSGHMTSMGGRNHNNSRTTAGCPRDQLGLQPQQRGGGAGLGMGMFCNGGNTAGNDCGGGLRHGGRGGCGRMVDGQMGGRSPKSSNSSDESAEGLVESSPTAVWQVEMRRGEFRGGGDDGGTSRGGGGRKRTLEAADANAIALLQPQTTTTQDVVSVDEMKQLFLCATMELEFARTSARDEIRSKEENLRQLLQFIKITMLRRDEPRGQLQELLAQVAEHRRPHEQSPTLPHLHHGLASSLELPNPITADCGDTAPVQRPLLEDDAPTPPGISSGTAKYDPGSAIIDRLAMNKALPEKGKLLQAVLDTGPLLQTLLVAGALPRWRNPPPLQHFQIPPVSATLNQNAVLNQNLLVRSSPNMFHHQNPYMAPQIRAPFPLHSPGLRALCMKGPLMSTCGSSGQDTVEKRQKF